MNGDSEHCADFIDQDGVCGQWEEAAIITFLRSGVLTREEAIRILDPETALEARAEYEYYGGFSGKETYEKAFQEAVLMAVSALRGKQKGEAG